MKNTDITQSRKISKISRMASLKCSIYPHPYVRLCELRLVVPTDDFNFFSDLGFEICGVGLSYGKFLTGDILSTASETQNLFSYKCHL